METIATESSEARLNLQKRRNEVLVPKSSLSLQQIIYYEYWFMLIYIPTSILSFVFKVDFLPFPHIKTITYEVIGLVSLYIMVLTKIKMGGLGNRNESSQFSKWYLILSLGSITGFVFFMKYQTFVLQLEFIINLMGLVFATMGFLFGFFAFQRFKKEKRNLYS